MFIWFSIDGKREIYVKSIVLRGQIFEANKQKEDEGDAAAAALSGVSTCNNISYRRRKKKKKKDLEKQKKKEKRSIGVGLEITKSPWPRNKECDARMREDVNRNTLREKCNYLDASRADGFKTLRGLSQKKERGYLIRNFASISLSLFLVLLILDQAPHIEGRCGPPTALH